MLLVDDEASVLLSSKMLLNSVGIKDVTTLEDSRDESVTRLSQDSESTRLIPL